MTWHQQLKESKWKSKWVITIFCLSVKKNQNWYFQPSISNLKMLLDFKTREMIRFKKKNWLLDMSQRRIWWIFVVEFILLMERTKCFCNSQDALPLHIFSLEVLSVLRWCRSLAHPLNGRGCTKLLPSSCAHNLNYVAQILSVLGRDQATTPWVWCYQSEADVDLPVGHWDASSFPPGPWNPQIWTW